MHTITHSQLSAHWSHKQVHSWAHVGAGWTDADRWSRWGWARAAFACRAHRSPFHTDPTACRLCTRSFCVIFTFLQKAFCSDLWLYLTSWNFSCPSLHIVTAFSSPHMQPPYLGFQFPCLVYMTRLGHSWDWNRGWLMPRLQRWIWQPVCFSICVCVSLNVLLWLCLSSCLTVSR